MALAMVVGSTSQTVAAIATLATFPGPSILVAAFMCLRLTIALPQWVPRRWMVVALLVEPVLITAAGLSNPWHLLVYHGAGAEHLTGSAGWTRGPIFWLDTGYAHLMVSAAIALVAWGWWRASPAFRGQRLAVFLAALAPFAANLVFLARGSSNVSDPTPLGFAAAGSVMWYATFRRDLLTFSPVARALIIDQISDAVVVISPNDRVLDVNPTANDLLRAMNPDAPTTLVGAPAMASKSGGTSAVACGPAPVSIQQTDGVSASTASHPDRSERKRLP